MDFVSWIKDLIKWVCRIFKKGLSAERAERAEKCLEKKECCNSCGDFEIHVDKTNGFHLDIKDTHHHDEREKKEGDAEQR